MTVLILLIFFLILLILYGRYEPRIDIIHNDSSYVKNHQIYLWYNGKCRREYIKLFEFD